MTKFRRILWVLLFTVFAMGTIANTAMAAGMIAPMSTMDPIDMDLENCDSCGSDDTSCPTCDIGCVAQLATIVNTNELATTLVSEKFTASPRLEFSSRTGPPEPAPPRRLDLT
jgi:hypothetical protein